MRKANLDVTKIDKSAIHVGAKGKYIDVLFFDNRDGTDEYGNDGFVVQSISKERRDAGERGPIIGNWKESEPIQPQSNQSSVGQNSDDGDDIPF